MIVSSIEPLAARAVPPARTRRLLFVLNDAKFFLSHRLPIALAAAAAGYEVHVATPPSDEARRITAHGLRFWPYELDRSSMSPFEELRAVGRLVRLYARVRPHIVHHVSLKPVLYGTIAARVTRVPAVVNAVAGLGYSFGAGRSALRELMIGALRLGLHHRNAFTIFQNPDDRGLFVNRRIVDLERTVLIRGSGVDTEHYVPSDEPAGPPVALLASRMLWDKGVGEFVESARQLRSDMSARFVLVGPSDRGNPKSVSEAQLVAWNDEGVIEWWGARSDMPTVFSQCHVAVLPSYYGEGVPKVLLEAAACGRPIVTTDEPGCREVVVDGQNGLLVPARDPFALSRALRRLLESAELRKRMGHASRKRCLAQFGVKNVVRQTLAVYEQALPDSTSLVI